MRAMIASAVVAVLAVTPLLANESESERRLGEAATVLSQIMGEAEQRIPEELFERAHCLVVVPDLQVGPFVVTGTVGKGYVVCRTRSQTEWSAPAALRIQGGRIGFHIGGSSADLVMLVMNNGAADRLLDSKYTLGAEGTVAAGPVGRTLPALTDEQRRADILAWSRSNGLLNGVALEGTTLHQDLEDNQRLYGRRLATRDIVAGAVAPPPAARSLLAFLNRYGAKVRAQ